MLEEIFIVSDYLNLETVVDLVAKLAVKEESNRMELELYPPFMNHYEECLKSLELVKDLSTYFDMTSGIRAYPIVIKLGGKEFSDSVVFESIEFHKI